MGFFRLFKSQNEKEQRKSELLTWFFDFSVFLRVLTKSDVKK
jgi:hypothetical protein